MFNLLRMDIKRLRKAKASYIILLLSMIAVFIFFLSFYVAMNPALQEWMKEHGFIFQVSGLEATQIMPFMDVFHVTYTQNFMALFIGIAVIVFNCHEHESGFSKNIFSIHVNRLHYIISKTIALSLYIWLMLCICISEAAVINVCLSSFFTFPALSEVFLYLLLLCLLTMAFVCLYTSLSIWLQSKAGCIGTVIFYATGIWLSIVQPVFSILGWQKILDYTLLSQVGALNYYAQSMDVNGITQIIVVAVSAICLYTALSALKLRKKDI